MDYNFLIMVCALTLISDSVIKTVIGQCWYNESTIVQNIQRNSLSGHFISVADKVKNHVVVSIYLTYHC